MSGGSSGGSAVAVSSGTAFAALGSDTGGSTRNPASYCGLVGLKPSYGLVSRHGLIPLVNSMDVPGILARTVEDALHVLNAIAGPDPRDLTTIDRPYVPFHLEEQRCSSKLPLGGDLRIGLPREYLERANNDRLDEQVRNCWDKVCRLFQEAGATLVPVSLPNAAYSVICYSILNSCEVASNMARYDGIEYGLRADVANDASLDELLAKSRRKGLSNVVRSRILAGNYFLLSDNYEDFFVKAMKVRRLIAQDFERAWDAGVDVILTPTTLSDAPLYSDFVKLDNRTQCEHQDLYTLPANMAGIPAVSIPVGVSRRGLPLSLQLMAPHLRDEQLLIVAKWIQDAVDFPQIMLKDGTLLE